MRLLLLLLFLAASASAQSWSVQTSGLDTNLRGVSVTQASAVPIIWACGSHGVILRSIDAGKTWVRIRVPDADALDFRSIQAFGAQIAYVMSIGSGSQSRIYKTTDGGKNWMLEYTGKRDAVFLDDLVCISKIACFALSDPVDGKFLLLATRDGLHWQDLPRGSMPPALPGEGVFAASGTSLAIYEQNIYSATGGASVARVFRSRDLGRTWAAFATPIASSNSSSGIFSIARKGNALVVVGGDYKVTGGAARAAAYSLDGGTSWHLAASALGGFRSAVAFLRGSTVIAVGPSGEDISRDAGAHWTPAGSLNLNAVAAFDSRQAWGVGAKGTIALYK
ncbi:MAG: YCF48-related protein [Candidatus Acidiferrales bacterium]